MKGLVKSFCYYLAVQISNELRELAKDSTYSLVWRRAVDRSADFVERHLEGALLFRDVKELRAFAVASAPKSGLILEFGVHKGNSTTIFAKRLKADDDARLVYGFDSFVGLRDDWFGWHLPARSLSMENKPPQVPDNVRFVKGWIEDTLGPFLDEHPDPIAFIHVDTDTYPTAKYILETCKDRMAEGALILFDELIGYPNWENGEFRALNEVFAEADFTYKAFSERGGLIQLN